MEERLPLVGVAVACGACCAVQLLMPMLVGVASSGVGAAVLGWKTGLAMLAGLGILTAVYWTRQARKRDVSRSADTSCDCNTSSAGEGAK